MTSKREAWQTAVLEQTEWTVKKAQFSRGHDGPSGYMTCDLHRNGKIALHVIDDSMGGGFMYQGSPQIKSDWRQNDKDFIAFCKSLPNCEPSDLFPEGMDVNADMVADYMAMREVETRSIKRKMKRNLFLLQDGQVSTLKFKADLSVPAIKERCVENALIKYPKAEILNDIDTIVDHIT